MRKDSFCNNKAKDVVSNSSQNTYVTTANISIHATDIVRMGESDFKLVVNNRDITDLISSRLIFLYNSDEDFAKYLGNNFTGAYTDGLWINGKDTSLGDWSVDNNSSYVIRMDWS